MRVLRATNWSHPERPLATISRDGDFRDTLERVVTGVIEKMNREGSFVTYDIFEMPDGDEIAATIEAGQRTAKVAQQEAHQALFYHYLTNLWENGLPDGRKPNPHAVMAGDERMPLSVDEIRFVYEQLVRHPLYNDFFLSYIASDGTIVNLRHGRIEIGTDES